MKPVQFEPIEQPQEPEYIITENKLEIFERVLPGGYQKMVDVVRSRPYTAPPLRRFSTKELVDELSRREGVKEINLRMACMQDFRGHDRCLVIKE